MGLDQSKRQPHPALEVGVGLRGHTRHGRRDLVELPKQDLGIEPDVLRPVDDEDLGTVPILRAMRSLTRKPLEADLMIANPDRYAGKFAEAGADYVIIHVEASQNPRQTFREIRDAGGRPGISLSPGTPPQQSTTTSTKST